jgi:hypothetical protein
MMKHEVHGATYISGMIGTDVRNEVADAPHMSQNEDHKMSTLIIACA